MNKAKTLKMKLIYVVAAIAMLAMLIPAMAIPVSAAGPYLTMTLVDPMAPTGQRLTDAGYNVTGSIVEVTAYNEGGSLATVTGWTLLDLLPGSGTNAKFYPTDPLVNPTANPIQVIGDWGEVQIIAQVAGAPVYVDKKWGKIKSTDITAPQTTYVTWNESAKSWSGTASITDTVLGMFKGEFGPIPDHLVQGVKLNWYLIDGNVPYAIQTGENPAVKNAVALLDRADFVTFDNGATYIQTVSNTVGASTVNLLAWGEEAVKVVVVPEYPGVPQLPITTEITTVNFWTREMEVVPQVRWIGEKIVLEKNFTMGLDGHLVNFVITSGEGALESFGPTPNKIGLNLTSNGQSVWTEVDDNGVAAVILTADAANQVNVRAAIYAEDGITMINQHAFTVYFLKFESLTLGDVVGKRAGHNTGIWTTPSNPWNLDFPAAYTTGANADVLMQDRNVSQDALERAQVRGWFMGVNKSTRPELDVDLDQDGEDDVNLPKGRWVLPDDWAKLAGYYNWQERRIHWDIMDSPGDAYTIATTTQLTGPFSPGIELMTPLGWDTAFISPDDARIMRTVFPNTVLDVWDAPMPPAKIIFEIINGANTTADGFFKDAMKSDIYKLGAAYSNPFYQAMIPAHWAIPAFINNGGYDWDSFLNDGQAYGPYVFWTIFNRPGQNAAVPSADWSGHPTKVEVYSDNHGEAMVFLNGDWNLDLSLWTYNGGVDVSPLAEVGSTTVQAMADYPYVRVEAPIVSNTVEKTFFWGGEILGTDGKIFSDGEFTDSADTLMVLSGYLNKVLDPANGGAYPDEWAFSDDKMVFVWVTDRDGLIAGVNGAQVKWSVSSGAAGAKIAETGTSPVMYNDYNDVTQGLMLVDGFLQNTAHPGYTVDVGRTIGYSFLRAPTAMEKKLFLKKWGVAGAITDRNPDNYAVAAIKIVCGTDVDVTVETIITGPEYGANVFSGGGSVTNFTNVDFAISYPLDDPIVVGDANGDGVVTPADIAAVQNIIMGKCAGNINADTNLNGVIDMGDVVKIVKIIRGLN